MFFIFRYKIPFDLALASLTSLISFCSSPFPGFELIFLRALVQCYFTCPWFCVYSHSLFHLCPSGKCQLILKKYSNVCLEFTILTMINVQFGGGKYIHNFMQLLPSSFSRTFFTVWNWNSIPIKLPPLPLSPAPGSHHSSLCPCEFDYPTYLI